MSTLREDLISIISVGANNISKVEKLEKLFKQQMLDLLGDHEDAMHTGTDWEGVPDEKIMGRNELRHQLRQEVEKL